MFTPVVGDHPAVGGRDVSNGGRGSLWTPWAWCWMSALDVRGDLDSLIRTGVLRLLEVDDEFRRDLASMLREEQSSSGAELDSAAAAARLGFNRETVVRMAKGGRIPGAHKQGREWRFPADGLTVLPAGGREITVTMARPALKKQRGTSAPSAVEALLRAARASDQLELQFDERPHEVVA